MKPTKQDSKGTGPRKFPPFASRQEMRDFMIECGTRALDRAAMQAEERAKAKVQAAAPQTVQK